MRWLRYFSILYVVVEFSRASQAQGLPTGFAIDPASEAFSAAELNSIQNALKRVGPDYRPKQHVVTLFKDSSPQKKGERRDLVGEFEESTFRIMLYPASYSDLYDKAAGLMLERTLIHELTHAIDLERGISSSDAWKKLSGWTSLPVLGWLGLFNSPDNAEDKGYGRDYGKDSEKEDLATFAEEFFYPTPRRDPEMRIHCRAPSKFAFFSHNLREPPTVLGQPCAPVESWIDPSKVEGLEILLASPSSISPASMAGHLLLRVRIKNSPADDDPIISFGADLPEDTTSGQMITGGITGKFLSTLIETPLSQTVLQYTELEDRDLWRYSLLLSTGQIRAVLERLFEVKKNYRAKYKFLTKNCAAILVDQLGIALQNDDIPFHPPLFVSPSMLLARLSQKGLVAEVSPSFYSLSRKAEIAREKKRDIYQEYSRLIGGFPYQVPTWESIESDHLNDRIAAYQALARLTPSLTPELKEKTYLMLLLSLDGERRRQFVPGKGVGKPSEAHEKVRRVISEVRNDAELKSRIPELARQHSTKEIYGEEELRSRLIGSAHTGTQAIVVTPTYSIVNREGHFELAIKTTLFSQDLGDTSRFALARGMSMDVLPSVVVVDLDQKSITRWYSAMLLIRSLPQHSTAHGDEIKNVFADGLGGLGAGLRILEFSGDRWRRRKFEAHWLTPEIVANLVSSRAFRSYLNVALGLQVGNVWMTKDAGNSRFWVGLPLEIQGQLSFDEEQKTLVRLGATFTPQISTDEGFRDEIEARLILSQYLAEVMGVELRIEAGAEYEHPEALRFLIGAQARGW